MIAMIMLVLMTLGSLALIRSVDTTNMIAGNLAFQQAATTAGDMGVEVAVSWLEANNTGTTLHANILAQGYSATRQDPAVGQSWDAYWNNVLVPAGQVMTVTRNASGAMQSYNVSSGSIASGFSATQYTAGNSISYVIQRLCNATGDPVAVGVDCSVPQSAGSSGGSSKGAGVVALLFNSQIYYRITSRVAGPRNAVSYVQVIVSL